MIRISSFSLVLFLILTSCGAGSSKSSSPQNNHSGFTGANNEVRLMTLDPGHFHAALIQKTMYNQIDPLVYVYAPQGEDVQNHLARIKGYNSRAYNPTSWQEKLYTGPDFFERMIQDKPGNVVVVSGNNAKKTDYILKTIQAGINVLADKPMVISPDEFPKLEKAFQIAKENQVLLYDIMTERYNITNILQRKLSEIPGVFGQLRKGTTKKPGICRESVHHFFKYVSGKPLKRPPWYFDVKQQGEGLVDVNTHLVDLIQWSAFPEIKLKKKDVEIISARRWATDITPEMFKTVTGEEHVPNYLHKDLNNRVLKIFSNGEINYKLKGIHSKVSVVWNFQAPEGAGDTHYAIMRGSKCNLIIKQGKEQDYKPTLYVEATQETNLKAFENHLHQVINNDLKTLYPGLKIKKKNNTLWIIEIPDHYKIGHEAQFNKVTNRYLQYLKDGDMPDWEISNMIIKYYTTTEGLKAAKNNTNESIK